MNALLIRMRELSKMLNYGESTLYDKLNPKSKYYDPDFPRPIALSNSPRGAKAWRVSAVEAWLELRAQKSPAPNESSPVQNSHDTRDKYEISARSKTLGMPGVLKKKTRGTETFDASTKSHLYGV